MGYFKTLTFVEPVTGTVKATTKVNINAEGQFYANLLDEFKAIAAVFTSREMKNTGGISSAVRDGQIFNKTFDALSGDMFFLWEKLYEKQITTEKVILYQIEPHVVFCTDEVGTVFPHGGFVPDEKKITWADGKVYGLPTFGNLSSYSLGIGARVMTKETTIYGSSTAKKVDYSLAGEGSHLHPDNPTDMLNSFVRMSASIRWKADNPKESVPGDGWHEIPYSDHAAMFFYSMIMQMIVFAKNVVEGFESENIQKALNGVEGYEKYITPHTNLLGGPVGR